METRKEIERLFLNEVKEKKRIGSGIYSRTGSRGYIGKMRFPTDLLKGSEKRKYKGTGKIIVSNLYDVIIPKEEFDLLEVHEKRNRLQYWRNTKTTKEIKSTWNMSANTLYKIIDELGLPKDVRKSNGRKGKTITKKLDKPKNEIAIQTIETNEPIEIEPIQIVKTGINFSVNGIYNDHDLKGLFSKLEILIDGLNKIEVDIIIKELK